MFEAFSALFFGMVGITMFALFACFTTFLVPWKIYSHLYDQTNSFFVSFFTAFFAGSVAVYLWVLISYALLFSIV
jgi:hypothetical protein